MITNLNDPEVKKSIELLGEEDQKLIRELLQKQAFTLPLNVRLLQAIKESLQGIERVEIPLTDLISALGNGAPLTAEEARQRFEKNACVPYRNTSHPMHKDHAETTR